jgi:uncharacterized membrane protein YfcA
VTLSPNEIVALLGAVGFTAGFVDAIAGGGGLLTVPALLVAGLPPHTTLATNKAQAVWGAASSAVAFWRRDGVDKSRAPFAFALGFLGSLLGAFLVTLARPEPLRPVVLVLLLAAAVIVVLPRERIRAVKFARPAIAYACAAFALGTYDGFFGPGVGSMLIVANVMIYGDSLTFASGNAKVVNFGSNLAALLLFLVRGAIVWKIALVMAACNALGAAVGARLALKRGDKLVRVVVLVVVFALVVKVALSLTST